MVKGVVGDLEIVRRMLAGDEEVFTAFFEDHFARLYRFALPRMGHDAAAAEDVVQSALCKAITHLRTYRGEAALFTWLCTFCRHEISAHFRRQKPVIQAEGLLEDIPEIRAALDSLAASLEQDPENQLYRKEVSRLVQVTLDSLPASYGDALEWKYIQGLSVEEIAAKLEIGLKAAESVLSRAREAFREAFAVFGPATHLATKGRGAS
ncbi:MAG TPA: RNA polymerase sigma factor [Candidatus Polarisedimenticolia bacterium]|nr:RNA polymerase sigma factor [Candidatus Polarisedimenticolia bacterium]